MPRLPALALRKALYFGLFGALGATLGWFCWIAVTVLLAKTADVWVSALIGGLLGVFLDGVRHYRKRSGARAAEEDRRYPVLTPLLGAAGVFVGAVGESSLGELIKEVRLPFLFSVLTFFVGGIGVLAVTEGARYLQDDEDLADELADAPAARVFYRGFVLTFLSVFVAVPISLVNIAAGGGVAYTSLVAWWVVIGVIAGFTVLNVRRSIWRAVTAGVGAVLVLLMMFVVVGLGPAEEFEVYAPGGAAGWGRVFTQISRGLLDEPDVPARTWTLAQRQLRTGGTAQLIDPDLPVAVPRLLHNLSDCDTFPARPDAFNPASYLARKKELCAKIDATTGPEWTRSLIVIAAFSAALAAATRVERRWRPADYQTHPIRNYDRAALVLAVAGLLAGILILRLA
ncbi:MAG: hypothetical protein HOY71_22535 [Nonomuraea sp.]|nr:hypothetical protein [Nonomuraea sp.]